MQSQPTGPNCASGDALQQAYLIALYQYSLDHMRFAEARLNNQNQMALALYDQCVISSKVLESYVSFMRAQAGCKPTSFGQGQAVPALLLD